MSKPSGALIAAVKKGSLAAQAGLRKGDILLSIGNQRLQDYIHYRFLISAETLTLKIHQLGRGQVTLHLEKDIDEDLGLQFAEDVFDGVRTCRCNCAFCFVSQLPPGLREALYLRDDDYRLSFLHGNFITLSNLTEADFRRILGFHLSPLWVSVHATDEAVRGKLMGSSRLPPILPQIKRLTEGGIEIHAQIVLCPGVNDGPVLAQTVQDLAKLHPGIASIGIVPAAITSRLQSELNLSPVTAGGAREIIQQVDDWQREFFGCFGTALVWASDEFYLLAGKEFPPAAEYEAFCQRGNGIGEARIFLDELASTSFLAASRKLSAAADKPRVTLATGPAPVGLVSRLAEKLNQAGVTTQVVVATNQLFGPAVTCAGLIPGADWRIALQQGPPADLAFLPRQALNHDGLFLDDVSGKELAKQTGVKLVFASGPNEVAAALLKSIVPSKEVKS